MFCVGPLPLLKIFLRWSMTQLKPCLPDQNLFLEPIFYVAETEDFVLFRPLAKCKVNWINHFSVYDIFFGLFSLWSQVEQVWIHRQQIQFFGMKCLSKCLWFSVQGLFLASLLCHTAVCPELFGPLNAVRTNCQWSRRTRHTVRKMTNMIQFRVRNSWTKITQIISNKFELPAIFQLFQLYSLEWAKKIEIQNFKMAHP